MQKSCRQCTQKFDITDDDLKFYDKISPVFAGKKYLVPPPTLCPECRSRRRLAFRNERKLYHRKCDLSGKAMVSMYSPEKQYRVYAQPEWWSDKWDPLDYGCDFDFTRPFFEQFLELWKEVPLMNVIGENNENSDYCNLTANGKNNYLVFESSNNEDCLYGYWLQKSNACLDSSFSDHCQFCYEIDNCFDCYNLQWSRDCSQCHDSAFLVDSIGCADCLFSCNLRNKQFYIFNEPYSKEEYFKRKKMYLNGSLKKLQSMQKEFNGFLLKQPHRSTHQLKTENCRGDYLQNSKNLVECFHAYAAEDCKYGEHLWRNSKNNMDVSTVGRDAELVYESINTAINAFQDAFCIQCWSGTSNLLYCFQCFSSSNAFGCIGLRQKKYCILNKQYTKEEYEKLVPKIIEQMNLYQEWGEFFPVSISPFAYNETVAQEFSPLSEKEAEAEGILWKKKETENYYNGPVVVLPDQISDASDELIKMILKCGECSRNYRLIAQELNFYRKFNIPLPQFCPDCRHKMRTSIRNPRKLYARNCAKCTAPIQTTYAPERQEIVYCKKCYLDEVY